VCLHHAHGGWLLVARVLDTPAQEYPVARTTGRISKLALIGFVLSKGLNELTVFRI